MYTMQGTFRLH